MTSGAANGAGRLSAANEPPAIILREVSKRYRLRGGAVSGWVSRLARIWPGERAAHGMGAAPKQNFQALRNVSFEVAAGESLGIIGRNGSGKSTLLQILAGLTKPTSGSGQVNGEVAALLELGTGFHPDFTGRENISLNNALLGVSRAAGRERMARIEAFAELGSFMDEPIRTYSSGMLLRLGFACAVAVEPEVFLVDEALGVGDIFFQQKCYEFMRGQMKGKTRVIVSHDLQAVTTFCTRVLVLMQGAMVFDGPPLAAVEFYLKALHDEQPAGPTGNGAGAEGDALATGVKSRASPLVCWRPIVPESTGGIGEVRATHFELRVNGGLFSSAVKPGDLVSVKILIECDEAKSQLLFGYLVRDKRGNDIFGENSARVEGGIVPAGAGQSEVAFEFVWPEARPGEYFLTLGAGEGRDATRHRIQCWAHNLHLFHAISPGRPVHCLFNNALRGFSLSARPEEPVETLVS